LIINDGHPERDEEDGLHVPQFLGFFFLIGYIVNY